MRPSEQAALQLVQTYGEDAPKVVADYHQAFPERSRVLNDIEVYAGIFRPTPVSEGPDMLQRMEGRREVFQWIRTVLSLTTEDVRRLIPNNNGDDDAAS
jgi:hypothetical protein